MRLIVFSGYTRPTKGKRKMAKRSHSKFSKAAKACKGRKQHAFRACMKSKLKKHKR